MNLEPKHIGILFVGGSIGALLGLSISFLLKPGIFPDAESFIGLQATGALFGSLAGLAVAVIATVVDAARDPGSEAARNFTQLNGMGSTLVGRRDQAEDGSYWTTEWFTILWLPVFPVCRYRVLPLGKPNLAGGSYQILGKEPPATAEYVPIYAKIYGVLAVVVLIGYFLFRAPQ